MYLLNVSTNTQLPQHEGEIVQYSRQEMLGLHHQVALLNCSKKKKKYHHYGDELCAIHAMPCMFMVFCWLIFDTSCA